MDKTQMDLVYLQESQAEAFDTEYHGPTALKAKIDALREAFPNGGPKNVLDLGGGAGHFADRLLEAFPSAKVTLLDSSETLLARNRQNERKTLIGGSVSDMSKLLAGQKFDAIAINWLLHHLVGTSRRASWNNCLATLAECHKALAPNGILLIAENAFDGPFGSNLPSHTIFGITSVTHPAFVKVSSRYFNTAGTGVCFQSNRAWQIMLRKSGFSTRCILLEPWRMSFQKKMKLAALGLLSPARIHYLCKPL